MVKKSRSAPAWHPNQIKAIKAPPETDKPLSIDEATKFVHLAKQTIYQLVGRNEIPFSKKNNRLYFSRMDLLDWITNERIPSITEANNDAGEYLSKSKIVKQKINN